MDAVAASDFIHVYEPASHGAGAPLLLLHGTGGDERDLLPVGRIVAPGAALLSPRGRVLEGQMPRFFRRLAEGVFDEADLIARTHELADFVMEMRERHGFAAPVALGFSNGANIAASLLLLRPETVSGAILLRAMPPFAPSSAADRAAAPALAGKRILLLSGAMDPIIPAAQSETLAQMLGRAGAEVDHRILPSGHGLSQADLTIAAGWYAGR